MNEQTETIRDDANGTITRLHQSNGESWTGYSGRYAKVAQAEHEVECAARQVECAKRKYDEAVVAFEQLKAQVEVHP